MTEIHITEEKKNSTAVLVGVETPEMRDGECDASLDELERLLETAGGRAVIRLVQSKENPDVRTFLGSGYFFGLRQCDGPQCGMVLSEGKCAFAARLGF